MAAFDRADLASRITAILTAPGVDLDVVSAKAVRRQLADQLPTLDVQEHKAAIDALIGEIFHEVAAMNDESEDEPLANGEADVKPDVKPALPSLDDSNGVPASSPAVPLAPSTSKTKRVKIEVDGEQLDGETDEQMARRLQSEYNGRESLSRRAAPKRSSSGVARGAKKGAKGSRSKISDEFIEDSDDENGSSSTAGPMRTAKKKSSGGGAKGGFAKEYQLAPELAVLVGSDRMSRPQVVKNLWVYIREHDLQNPAKRTEIICDEKFQACMGTATTTIFRMNSQISRHISPLAADAA